MAEAIPAMLFDEVKGSLTSPDGQTVFLHTDTVDGEDLLLGFPHERISAIIENLAMQLPHGRNAVGEKVMTAFTATGYEVGKGPKGEPVLSFLMGETGKMSFLLNQEMIASLVMHLSSVATKN